MSVVGAASPLRGEACNVHGRFVALTGFRSRRQRVARFHVCFVSGNCQCSLGPSSISLVGCRILIVRPGFEPGSLLRFVVRVHPPVVL